MAAFFPVRRGLLPVVRDFLCIIPTEQVLYYRNLGLYYGLASGTLPLYSDPCLGVRGGCVACEFSDSVKRHLSRRHLSVLNLEFDFISDGGCTREEQIAISLNRHLFPHGRQRAQGFLDLFFDAAPHLEIYFPICSAQH